MRLRIAASIGLICTTTSLVAGDPPRPPYFVGEPYNVTVNVGGPTPVSFSFTGEARDPDENQIVSLFVANAATWGRITTTPGNPARFELRGVDLDRSDVGAYLFGVTAIDNGTPQSGAVSRVNIFVVLPEPTGLMLPAFLCSQLCQRRRIPG